MAFGHTRFSGHGDPGPDPATATTVRPVAMSRPGKKDGGACGTAKFREETSKKADSATMGRIAAMHNVGDQSFVCK
jgi:hypothetical protein